MSLRQSKQCCLVNASSSPPFDEEDAMNEDESMTHYNEDDHTTKYYWSGSCLTSETAVKSFLFLEALRRSGKVRIIADDASPSSPKMIPSTTTAVPSTSVEEQNPFIELLSPWCTNEVLSVDNDDESADNEALLQCSSSSAAAKQAHDAVNGDEESRMPTLTTASAILRQCQEATNLGVVETAPHASFMLADFDVAFSVFLDDDELINHYEVLTTTAASLPPRVESENHSISPLQQKMSGGYPSMRALYEQQRQRRKAAQLELNAMRSAHGTQLMTLYDQLKRQQSVASRVFRRSLSSALPATTWRVIAKHAMN
ncbi:Hypothetical protein, putative [Bodo saltans]|uniref:Uncharacterized protein n=1 Tax=Bodo saltans TaxID=75058 RepID=A0A0S4JWU9_BODSA|nr:Hypothetical protein, putative [Bodo saltans]|eukprot:CUG93617.1 Hypothetical protein, putative [Bodo saltans]